MRVVHLSKSDSGGATFYARNLDKGLQAKGIESRLVLRRDTAVCPSVAGVALNRFVNRAVGRFFVEVQNEVFHRTNQRREQDLTALFREADVVHIHQITNWMGASNLLEDIPTSVPIVFTLHDLWAVTGGCVIYKGCDNFRDSCRACPALSAPFSWTLANRQLKQKAAAYNQRNITFVANSEWTQRQTAGASLLLGRGDLPVIHPPVDTSSFLPPETRAARTELNIPLSQFVVCTGSASITDENKNIAGLFRALKQVTDHRNIQVVIFGDGHLDIPEDLNVRFLGRLDRARDLATVYQASDLFVSMSQMETYGMTLIEAMACGVPVIAYRTGAIPDVVEHGSTGVLVELGDETEIANAIESLRLKHDQRQKLGRSARKVVVERNGLQTFIQRHLDLYQKICAHKRKPV